MEVRVEGFSPKLGLLTRTIFQRLASLHTQVGPLHLLYVLFWRGRQTHAHHLPAPGRPAHSGGLLASPGHYSDDGRQTCIAAFQLAKQASAVSAAEAFSVSAAEPLHVCTMSSGDVAMQMQDKTSRVGRYAAGKVSDGAMPCAFLNPELFR